MKQFIRIRTSLVGYNKKVIESHIDAMSDARDKALDVLKKRVENLKDEKSKLQACLSELIKEKELLESENQRFDLFIEWMSNRKSVKISSEQVTEEETSEKPLEEALVTSLDGELSLEIEQTLETEKPIETEKSYETEPISESVDETAIEVEAATEDEAVTENDVVGKAEIDEANSIINSQKEFVDVIDNNISRLEQRITEMTMKIEFLSDQIREQSDTIQESKRSKLKLVEASNSDAHHINSEPENKVIKHRKHFEKAIVEMAQLESFTKEDELNDALATHIETYDASEIAEEKLVALNAFVRDNRDVEKIELSSEGFWGVAVNDFSSKPLATLSEDVLDGTKNPVFSMGYNSFFEMGYTSDHIAKPLIRQNKVEQSPRKKEVYKPKPSEQVKRETVATKSEFDFEAPKQAYKTVQKPIDADGELLRHKYIVGKIAGLDLYDRQGNRIIAKNEEITIDKVTIADREGKLAELIVNMVMSKSE